MSQAVRIIEPMTEHAPPPTTHGSGRQEVEDRPEVASRPEATERAERWAGTMGGHRIGGVTDGGAGTGIRHAHAEGHHHMGRVQMSRERREEIEHLTLAEGATRAHGAGSRAREEQPDPERTCFERDRDRVLHSNAFRRLAGKTQVFVFPEDHQRTRLTHALEVAQVATAIARAVGANVALTEAIALGHDCGHGPGGHASEDAFTPYVDGGYDHAVWGADVVLQPLNLCAETLDGIRNHSWSRPLPATPEGEIVSWADRVAYVCHDMEDAAHVGIVSADMLPPVVVERCGSRRGTQLGAFIDGVVAAVADTGRIGMTEPLAEARYEFRAFNYEHIYMRPASLRQSESVIRVLRALVEYHADRPNLLGGAEDPATGTVAAGRASGGTVAGDTVTAGRAAGVEPGSDDALRAAVTWVGGMTDRYAFAEARARLGWRTGDLPRGIA